MKYTVISGKELDAGLISRWREIVRSNSQFANPFFHPGFTRAVAQVRCDVRVGLLEDGGTVVGFFPFHRSIGGLGRPVGLGLSDYHGVICERDADWTAKGLLRSCRLVRWTFDHLPAFQQQFLTSDAILSPSPTIELNGGYATYEATCSASARKQLREVDRKRAKLRASGRDVRTSDHRHEPDALAQLRAWKSAQCRRTGTTDYFSFHWCAELVEVLQAAGESDFGAHVLGLCDNGIPIALHYVLYTPTVWHSWFPGYDLRFHDFSPGAILLQDTIRAAASGGVSYLDLGKGMSLYKEKLMTGANAVAEGVSQTPCILNRIIFALNSACRPKATGKDRVGALSVPRRLLAKISRACRYR